MRLSLWSQRAVVFWISSKLVHTLGLQTPITAECSMRRCWATSWGTCRGHDGMWPPKLGLSRSIGRRVMTFRIFSSIAAVRHFEFKKKINIWSRDCHCGPNLCLLTKFHENWFTRSVSRRPQLLNVQCVLARQRPMPMPWQPLHAGHVADMMAWVHPSCVPVGPSVGELWHFDYIPTWRLSAILNFKNINI